MDTPSAPKRWRKTIVAIVIASAVLGAAEAGARYLRLTPDPWTAVQTLWAGVGLPEMATVLEPDPVLLWRVRRGLERAEVKGYLAREHVSFRVSTDAHGFRTSANASAGSEPAVLVLGDSTAFGAGIEAEETYAARLDELLPAARVLNGAIPSGTAYQARRLLEQAGVDPACVVACIGTAAGDASWLENLTDPELARFETSRRRWQSTCGLYFLLVHDFPTDRYRRGQLQRRSRLSPPELVDEVTGLAGWCTSRDIPVILMSWIEKGQKVHTEYQTYVTDLAESEELRLLDVFEVLKNRDPDRLFIDAFHLKPEGHALVAESLAPLVERALGAE
jgi:lysophospholipase L1-like esterase